MYLKNSICIFMLALWPVYSLKAASFQELLDRLDQHELVTAQLQVADSISARSEKEGSWGDPMINLAAVNFPRETLNRDASMMTGIRLGLSQSINLSGKYGQIEASLQEMAASQKASGLQMKRTYAKSLWELAADKRRLTLMIEIFEENLKWTKDNLKVTKRLYATGKVPQQAVLDIQMRKSQLESDLSTIKSSLKGLESELKSLLGTNDLGDLDLKTIQWSYLEKWEKGAADFDFKEKELEHQVKSSDLKVSAKNRNFLPDVQLGFNYTKRNDIDGLGDFVGASITIPLPTSSKRYAAKTEAISERVAAQKRYRHYQNIKPMLLEKLALEIKDQESQLRILNKETLRFAKSSRDVTARSYARGGADYVELLRGELQYQNQLLKKIELETNLKKKKVAYLFFKGDALSLRSLK